MRIFALLSVALVSLAFVGCKAAPLVPEDAWVQKVSTGYKFTEGPVYDGAGTLYFSDIPNGRVIKFDVATKRDAVARENSGGANGLFFDHKGRMVMCEGVNRRVTRLEDDGNITVLAAYTPFGNRLNSPNDLVVDYQGGIYFTDPKYGKDRASMEYKAEGVFFISPTGEVKSIISDLVRPNGIILSNNERVLYVADNAAKTIVAYNIVRPGVVTGKRIFCSLDPNTAGGVDGMTIDSKGNIYGAAQGKIWVWNPAGALISTIAIPEGPSNCTFVGNDLYVTARTSLYKVTLNATAGAGGR